MVLKVRIQTRMKKMFTFAQPTVGYSGVGVWSIPQRHAEIGRGCLNLVSGLPSVDRPAAFIELCTVILVRISGGLVSCAVDSVLT